MEQPGAEEPPDSFNRLITGLQASRLRQNRMTIDENILILIVEDSCESSSLSTDTKDNIYFLLS